MEQLLDAKIAAQVREIFQDLKHPVRVLLFVSQVQGEACDITRQLLEEVTALSDMLELNVYDLADEPDMAKLYRVEGKAPAIVMAASENGQIIDYGVRYLGVPAGHEFSTLIHSLLLVSGRDSGLSQQVRGYVKNLVKPLHLEVFVTPT